MSMRHASWIASTEMPRRSSSPIWNTRSGVGMAMAASSLFVVGNSLRLRRFQTIRADSAHSETRLNP